MNSLRIQQGQNVEVVTTSIIDKLYKAAISVSEPLGGAKDQAQLSGNLQVNLWYQTKKEYLEGRFPNLHINVTDGYYVEFEDPIVQQLCVTNFGDGVGITYDQMALKTSIGGAFKGNTQITSFEELKYFTRVTALNSYMWYTGGEFSNCTSLETIDFLNINSVTGGTFNGCSNLTTVKNFHVASLNTFMFSGCTKLSQIDLSHSTSFGEMCFSNNSVNPFTGINFSQITWIENLAFANCPLLTGDIIIPTTCNFEGDTVVNKAFVGTGISSIVVNNITKTSIGFGDGQNRRCFQGCNNLTLMDYTGCTEAVTAGKWLWSDAPRTTQIIKLPSSITTVTSDDYYADSILGSGGIGQFIIYATTPPTLIGNLTYPGKTYTNGYIYVPDNSISDYKTADGWSDYANVIRGISEIPVNNS